MNKYKFLLAGLLMLVSGVSLRAQTIYICKGQTFHAYPVGAIESITFDEDGRTDSMVVASGGDVHSFACSSIDSITPNRPEIEAGKAAVNKLYANESFSDNFGEFTCETVKGLPWITDFNTAKGTGYVDGSVTTSESYLISPAYDLSTAAKATLTFKYILRYVRAGASNRVLITCDYTGDPSTTQWTDITGTLTEGSSWYTFYDYSRQIPSRFIGESHVVIALCFACQGNSATWEVKNLQLTLDASADGQQGGGGGSDEEDKENLNRNNVSSSVNKEVWRLEFPHIKGDDDNLVITHSTATYGITYSLEWDCTKKSQRWTCYEFHDGLPNNKVGRCGSWGDDPNIPSSYRTHSEQWSGTAFSRGHMCMSNDRQSSVEQNKQTFYISNAHPQYQNHNGGLWQTLENKVNSWGNDASFRDTLYVVKAGTIDNEDQILQYTSTGLLVPKYFYMAVLCVKNGQYKAVGFWTEHTNVNITKANPRDYAVSIKQLEELTGIDFFCNLPDEIEQTVEASYTNKDWGF